MYILQNNEYLYLDKYTYLNFRLNYICRLMLFEFLGLSNINLMKIEDLVQCCLLCTTFVITSGLDSSCFQ